MFKSKHASIKQLQVHKLSRETGGQSMQPSQVACFSDDLKCWEAWDTTCGHKAKDIIPSIAWKREAWKEEALDNLPWKDERGPSSVRWTLEPFQRQCWGKLPRDGVKRKMMGFSERIDSILNWTELNWTQRCVHIVYRELSLHFRRTINKGRKQK